MIDKSLRKATAERLGDLIVVRMTGGGDCLWMNMYLDGVTGQMVCDSDIGNYSYNWGMGRSLDGTKNWTGFVCDWLSQDEWLLHRCIGASHKNLQFCQYESEKELRRIFRADNKDEPDIELKMQDLEDVIAAANVWGSGKNSDMWSTTIEIAADEMSVELPDTWHDCIIEDYTAWQKRFAEICREVIVPAIRRLEE